MKPGTEADRVLLAHMHECMARIQEYTQGERVRFGVDLLAVWLVVQQDLPALKEAVARMAVLRKAAE